MRHLLLPLALAALFATLGCKGDKQATTSQPSQVEYTCKCGKTATAPAGKAPS
jgi:hypothetical protein